MSSYVGDLISRRFHLAVKLTTLFFITLFCCFVLFWNSQKKDEASAALQRHAIVVENALWNMDPNALQEYLVLVSEYSAYEQVRVFSIQDSDPFIQVENKKHNALEQLFISARLIPRTSHSFPIFRSGYKIGQMEIIQLHMTIYVYLYFFLIVLLLWVASMFFFQVVRDKHTLEERVAERTRELHQNQERLRQSEKMDSIGRLAGGIAHDFNNMLAAIMGAAELLQMNLTESDEKNKNMVGMIITTAGRAADLTRQLLSFSRQNAPLTATIDFHVVLRDTLVLLKRTIDKRVEINSSLAATPSLIDGDLAQIQNAILNLGINAGDAMSKNGKLTLETEVTELDNIYCEKSLFELQPGSYLKFSLHDTGKGMDLETQKNIFEPFFTTKAHGKGTGLGLSAVYGMVCTHKGAIEVYSEPGAGSVFRLYFPLSNAAVSEYRVKEVEPLLATGRILVIDDEELIRTTVKMTLEDLGFDVLTAEDGEAGIRLYERHKHIDLVILDMIMPKMGGVDTFRALREIDPDAKVIIASGFSKGGLVNTLMAEGLLAFIGKPFRREDLVQVLSEVM